MTTWHERTTEALAQDPEAMAPKPTLAEVADATIEFAQWFIATHPPESLSRNITHAFAVICSAGAHAALESQQ